MPPPPVNLYYIYLCRIQIYDIFKKCVHYYMSTLTRDIWHGIFSWRCFGVEIFNWGYFGFGIFSFGIFRIFLRRYFNLGILRRITKRRRVRKESNKRSTAILLFYYVSYGSTQYCTPRKTSPPAPCLIIAIT